MERLLFLGRKLRKTKGTTAQTLHFANLLEHKNRRLIVV